MYVCTVCTMYVCMYYVCMYVLYVWNNIVCIVYSCSNRYGCMFTGGMCIITAMSQNPVER